MKEGDHAITRTEDCLRFATLAPWVTGGFLPILWREMSPNTKNSNFTGYTVKCAVIPMGGQKNLPIIPSAQEDQQGSCLPISSFLSLCSV